MKAIPKRVPPKWLDAAAVEQTYLEMRTASAIRFDDNDGGPSRAVPGYTGVRYIEGSTAHRLDVDRIALFRDFRSPGVVVNMTFRCGGTKKTGVPCGSLLAVVVDPPPPGRLLIATFRERSERHHDRGIETQREFLKAEPEPQVRRQLIDAIASDMSRGELLDTLLFPHWVPWDPDAPRLPVLSGEDWRRELAALDASGEFEWLATTDHRDIAGAPHQPPPALSPISREWWKTTIEDEIGCRWRRIQHDEFERASARFLDGHLPIFDAWPVRHEHEEELIVGCKFHGRGAIDVGLVRLAYKADEPQGFSIACRVPGR